MCLCAWTTPQLNTHAINFYIHMLHYTDINIVTLQIKITNKHEKSKHPAHITKHDINTLQTTTHSYIIQGHTHISNYTTMCTLKRTKTTKNN